MLANLPSGWWNVVCEASKRSLTVYLARGCCRVRPSRRLFWLGASFQAQTWISKSLRSTPYMPVSSSQMLPGDYLRFSSNLITLSIIAYG